MVLEGSPPLHIVWRAHHLCILYGWLTTIAGLSGGLTTSAYCLDGSPPLHDCLEGSPPLHIVWRAHHLCILSGGLTTSAYCLEGSPPLHIVWRAHHLCILSGGLTTSAYCLEASPPLHIVWRAHHLWILYGVLVLVILLKVCVVISELSFFFNQESFDWVMHTR